jgi:hypothetical protein
MTTAVLTPISNAPAVELGNRMWRKKLLPVGDIEYKGRTLHFTPQYLMGLAKSFAERAYDQVAFQLADAGNTHTNDPERYRGEIVSMDAEPDGLWLTLQPTEAGDKVLKENPKLGVSARIVEGYDRSDGKRFTAAIQHVLGTLDPRIPGLGAWQAIEAANPEPDSVWDLSDEAFPAGEPSPASSDAPVRTDMADLDALTDDQKARLAKLLALPDDQIEALASGGLVVTSEELEALTAPDEGDEELSDEELDALVAEAAELDAAGLLDEEPDLEGEPVAAGLSAEAQFAIDLANARSDETKRELAVVTARLREEDFQAEKRRLADLGVPPYLTELARPLLEGAGHAVELANGNTVDAGQIMRQVLAEYARQVKLLDLGVELGSPMDVPDDAGDERLQQQAADRDDVIGRAKSAMGFR